jgi:hypothetical protein
VHVERHPDATSFLERAGDYLLEREAEHNLILGLSRRLARAQPLQPGRRARAVGRGRPAGLVRGLRRTDAERHPHRPGLHAARAASPRLRERARRGDDPDAARPGGRFCFLFTDLANPTSNSIYQTVGYRPVADVDQWSFEAP